VWTNFLGKAPIREVARGLGRTLAGEFVWAKRTSEHEGNEQLLRVYETALVFLREPLPEPSDADQPIVWCVATGYHDPDARGEAFREHPNHKPFAALEPLVRTWSRPGDLILDPFAGSGSIPAAALRLGRDAACSELEPVWAQRVTERLREHSGARTSVESRGPPLTS
jgi:site-specific DNA-methyltransferase (adenine-specific)